MTTERFTELLGVLGVALLISCRKTGETPAYAPPPGISWATVLEEAADLNNLTRPPAPFDQSFHFSSSTTTNKVMLAHLAPKILGDMDHGFFLHVENQAEGVEATLADIQGPGMIAWIRPRSWRCSLRPT